MIHTKLDEQIAKLKGIDYHKTQYGLAADKLVPYWSLKILDAWELFEEMPGAYLKHIDRKDVKFKVYYHVFKNTGDLIQDAISDQYDEGSIGTTAPEAICLAWIKWKENENKNIKA